MSIVFVGKVNPQACPFGQLTYAFERSIEVVFDVSLYLPFVILGETTKVHPGKIDSPAVFMVALDVAQEVNLLKRGAQPPGRFFEPLICLLVALAKHPETHQAHYFRRAVNVFRIALAVISDFCEVHLHAVEECLNEVPLDFVLVHHLLEGVQHWVKADAFFDGPPSILPEAFQQFGLGIVMKSINDLVGKADKAVNTIDRSAEALVKQPDAHGEGSTVTPGDKAATFSTSAVEKLEMVHVR